MSDKRLTSSRRRLKGTNLKKQSQSILLFVFALLFVVPAITVGKRHCCTATINVWQVLERYKTFANMSPATVFSKSKHNLIGTSRDIGFEVFSTSPALQCWEERKRNAPARLRRASFPVLAKSSVRLAKAAGKCPVNRAGTLLGRPTQP